MNLVKMQILAGWNHYYANLGAVCANDYVDEVERCMEQDRKAVEMYHQMDQEDGMEWECHSILDLHTGMKMNAGIQSLCGSYH